MADAEKAAIREEKLPLEIKPKPKIGPRVNKRLIGFGLLSMVFVVVVIAFGLKLRSSALSGATANAPGNTIDNSAVIPLEKNEQNSVVTKLGSPVTTNPGAPNGIPPATDDRSKTNQGRPGQTGPGTPPTAEQTGPNPNGTPSYRPQSKMTDPFFGGNGYFDKTSSSGGTENQTSPTSVQQPPQHVETETEEARRVERAAMKSSKVIKVVGDLTVQAQGTTEQPNPAASRNRS